MNHLYQEMQGSAEVWLGEVPSQWRPFRIKDVARLSPNFSKGTPEIDELCSVIPMGKVSEKGEIISDNVEEYNLITSGLTSFEAGDVIFAKITPCMENGKGAYVKKLPTRYAFGSTEFHVLRPRQMVDGKFIYYFTYNSVYRDYAEANMTGAAGQKRVSSRFINYTRIFLPNIAVQVRIASYLDKTCAAIDKAIEAKQKQLETLDALRKSIIHKAVTRGLDDSVELKDSRVEWIGRIPRNWDVRRIKDIVALNSGDSITSESITLSGKYPVFGGNGLRGFTTSYTHDGYHVLIGRQGALCGNINYAEGKFWASEHAVVASTLTNHDTFWLGELLRVMNLNQYSNAAAQPGLAVEKIKFLRLPVPSYEEQHRIASFIRGKIVKNEGLVSNLQNQISTLEQYRKSLIHECVTGKQRITKDDVQDQL